jgi:hypothetical protein
VYKYLEHLTLNLVLDLFFLIVTRRASGRRTVIKKALISLISLGYGK